jgi:3-oxoacyl-[acyl-carrier-protein] synthase-3
MQYEKPIRIISFGKYLPRPIDSGDLEAKHELPQGWSVRYSGVSKRHMVTSETNGDMGAFAADEALGKANMTLDNIQMIISAGGTYDYPIPNQASIIKSKMKSGLKYDTPAIDLDSTCLSFVTALDFASKILDGNTYKNILIVSSEISSKGVNPANWETLTLFGDAAAAVIVSFDEQAPSRVIKGMSKTYSEGVYHTIIEGGGNKYFYKDHPYDSELYSFKMKGKKLLRLAKLKLPEFFQEFFKSTNYQMDNIDVFVPHQASKSGMMILDKLFKFPNGVVKSTLHKYGNCIAASIPLTLIDAIESGELKRGDTCLLAGTSAGFAIGAVLLKY